MISIHNAREELVSLRNRLLDPNSADHDIEQSLHLSQIALKSLVADCQLLHQRSLTPQSLAHHLCAQNLAHNWALDFSDRAGEGQSNCMATKVDLSNSHLSLGPRALGIANRAIETKHLIDKLLSQQKNMKNSWKISHK